jgi:hypothetical protein
MSTKHITALGLHHGLQKLGDKSNDRFKQVIALIRENYPVQILFEEWMAYGQTVGSTINTDILKWKNVGTPEEKRFETFAYGLNTDPMRYDPIKPVLQEYGPLGVHELREQYMLERIKEVMGPHDGGLFIVGLAHLHSMLSKLKAAGFEVRGYSWMGE